MIDPRDQPAPAARWWRRTGTFLATLWRRFIGVLRSLGPQSVPGPPAGRLTERWSIAPIKVPARGYAFDFQVHGMLVWTSEDVDLSDLRSLVETFFPHARSRLKSLAGGLARGVEPHRGEDFEGRLRRRLVELGDWAYERDGLRVTCRAHVRVAIDEQLRERIRPYWERLIELDYERDIAARRARHADGVSAQWAAILKKLLDAPEAGGAATMTDEQLATVVRDILAERRTWEEAMTGLSAQDEYGREGFFDPLGEPARRRPQA